MGGGGVIENQAFWEFFFLLRNALQNVCEISIWKILYSQRAKQQSQNITKNVHFWSLIYWKSNFLQCLSNIQKLPVLIDFADILWPKLCLKSNLSKFLNLEPSFTISTFWWGKQINVAQCQIHNFPNHHQTLSHLLLHQNLLLMYNYKHRIMKKK